MRTFDQDIIEWTITEAPDPAEWSWADEPELQTHSAAQPVRPFQAFARPPIPLEFSRWLWRTVGGLTAAALLGLAVYTGWVQHHIRQALARIVAAEDAAALAQDVETFLQFSVKDDDHWLRAQAALARAGQPAPLPHFALRPIAEPGRPLTLTLISPTTARVEVARRFEAPGGQPLTFLLPQFYRYREGSWKRQPYPAGLWGEARTRVGLHNEINYYPPDAAFVLNELGPYLDDLLFRACASLACAAGFSLSISLTNSLPGGSLLTAGPDAIQTGSGAPLLYAWINSSDLGNTHFSAPSPQASGYAADAAGRDAYLRHFGVQALLQTAFRPRLNPRQAYPAHLDPFAWALTARLAARLRLDSAQVLAQRPVPSTTSFAVLGGQLGARVGGAAPQTDALQAALGLLNHILRDLPAEAELRLLNTLGSKPDWITWLTQGTGLTPAELHARMAAANPDPYRLAIPAGARFALAVNCQAGPTLLTPGGARPTSLFFGQFAISHAMAWSPDGNQLSVYLDGLPAVVDLVSGSTAWLPAPADQWPEIQGWISETVVAYTLTPLPSSSLTPARLAFYDTAHPASRYQTVADVQEYWVSPDGSRAVSLQSSTSIVGVGEIILMPAFDQAGPLRLLDVGMSPAWAPDGQTVIYARINAAGTRFSIWQAEVPNGRTHHVFGLDQKTLRTDERLASARVAWSPTGRQIAFSLSDDREDTPDWLGLVTLDGGGQAIWWEQNGTVSPGSFSADGRYLAAADHNGGSPRVLVYEAATGALVRTLPAHAHFHVNYDWSPDGHQLVFNDPQGIALLAEPGDPLEQPRLLTGPDCVDGLWNPSP